MNVEIRGLVRTFRRTQVALMLADRVVSTGAPASWQAGAPTRAPAGRSAASFAPPPGNGQSPSPGDRIGAS